ncbi:hypothetical protein [Streptomyces sp. N35]|uniref:hypothetical protein n=1 Tax=Streptomyces sp. N35 TaxID=2795730 RepID=UPI0018F7C34C|nr:hypothetical protein [Streptomyces sp. N35]
MPHHTNDHHDDHDDSARHDQDHDGAPASAEEATEPGAGNRQPAVPQTAAEWREVLRNQPLPPEMAALPRRQRRRAKKAWRTAQRTDRTAAIRAERRNTPTGPAIPVIALVLAGVVAGAAWLWPDNSGNSQATAKPSPSASSSSTPAPFASDIPPLPTPSAASEDPQAGQDPERTAKGFATAYSTRFPFQDGTHEAAVERAAAYMSQPLVENLKRYDDLDFNQLVAAQASEAKPVKVTITSPAGKERPAPDTSVRVWRNATVKIAVKGTTDYTYTRRLTLEISRADTTPGNAWMVTRVLGVEQ